MRRILLPFILLAITLPLSAFDVKQVEEVLDGKAIAFPALLPRYDQSSVNLYLSSPAWTTWNNGHGGNWYAQYDTLTGHPRRVLGGTLPWIGSGATAADVERAGRDFIAANSAVLGVSNSRLRFVPAIAEPTSDGRIRYAAFDYYIDDVPVETARLVFAINSGNMIYWHSSNISDLPVSTTPALTSAQALASALAYAGVTSSEVTVVEQPTLKLLPRNRATSDGLTYQLVYEISFRLKGGLSTWGAYVDALTGSVVGFGDTNEYAACPIRTAATGRVTGGIRPAQATDAEVVRSFPLVRVDGKSSAQTSSANGTFSFTGGTVSTGLNGSFFDTSCEDCLKSESEPVAGFQPFVSSTDGRLNLGTGGRDVTGAPGVSTRAYGNGTSTPADRTAFYHTNVARSIALKWLTLPWLQTSVPVKVNINQVCNAFWNGTALNFFKSGQVKSGSNIFVCSNTGEIRDVMQHEWGHGLDSNDGRPPGLALGLGDLATGEAVADHIAVFVDHDSCIGQSFYNKFSGPFLTDPDTMSIKTCDGVRNLDELRATRGTLSISNVTQKCPGPPVSTGSPLAAVYVGPMLREGHCEGEIWGQTDYHLAQDLLSGRKYGTATLDANKQYPSYAGDLLPAGADGSANPAFDKDAAWTLLERLYFDSRPIVASYASSRNQAIGPSAYDGYLIVDDEGDGLTNGTPHGTYINDAYMHHEIAEYGLPGGIPAGIDSRNCAAPATPVTTLSQSMDGTSGTPAVTLSWTPVSGAASYSVLRNERRNDVFLEVARVINSSSFTDAGVDNGVAYNYRVQANSGSGCWASSAGGVQSILVAQPDVRTGGVTVTDTPSGNGDGALDAGEKAQLFIVLTNSGLAGLTNVTGTLTTLSSGVTVTKAGPRSYGSIAINGSAGPALSFAVALDNDGTLCGTTAVFILNVSSDQGCFALPVQLPIGSAGSSCTVFRSAYAQPVSMAITSDKLNATCGDGDLVPDPGETVEVSINVNNVGDKVANGVVVTLGSDKSYLSIPTASISLGSLAPLGVETKTATFAVVVARNTPFADMATLTATVSSSGATVPASRSMTTVVNRDKVLRSLAYDFETGAQGWTSSNPTGWQLTSMQATTGNLTSLWKENYLPDKCDLLYSPSLEFSAASSLSFDLAYVSENSDAPYDGVNVQASVDGGKTWTRVDIAQGYSALAAGSGCMSKGEPFFCGVSPLMQHYDADLSPFAGFSGQLRFRFSSDQLVDASPAGAWVDNIAAKNVIVSVPSVPCP